MPGLAGELQFDYDRLHRLTGIKSSHWQESQAYHAHLLEGRTTHDTLEKQFLLIHMIRAIKY